MRTYFTQSPVSGEHTREATLEIGGEFRRISAGGGRERTDHKHSRARELRQGLPGQVAQPALHTIPDDSRADGLTHHETHLRRTGTAVDEQVDHQTPRAGASAAAYR